MKFRILHYPLSWHRFSEMLASTNEVTQHQNPEEHHHQVTGGWRQMHEEAAHNFYSSSNIRTIKPTG
jgi:hypothetical protein